MYCKKCGKEVIPIKDQKTPGKQVANFFAFFAGAGAAYTYPKRCPFCNKVLRTKTQKIVGLICVIIIVILGSIMFFGIWLPKYL